jgi:8-oxo-dGTP pyrophosphatase MutT (NUDIX family)
MIRIREAVRALILDPQDRVLLVRFEFPHRRVWALPGGGLEPGESPRDALRRELREEVGLEAFECGPHLWTRLHRFASADGRFDGQREEVFLVRVTRDFAVRPALSWEALNAEFVFEFRWWSLAQLDDSDIVIGPRELRALLRRLLDEGPPAMPWAITEQT